MLGWGTTLRGDGARALEAAVGLCLHGGEKLTPGHHHVWVWGHRGHLSQRSAFSEAQWGCGNPFSYGSKGWYWRQTDL